MSESIPKAIQALTEALRTADKSLTGLSNFSREEDLAFIATLLRSAIEALGKLD